MVFGSCSATAAGRTKGSSGAVLDLTPEQFTRNVGGSYPSVQATLTHIMWAEWLWLERWRGRSTKLVFAATAFPTAVDLASHWAKIRKEQGRYVEGLSVDKLQQSLRYTNLKDEVWEYPLWRQLYHLLNHSSYHRGQVTNMLRQLGIQPPTTDFLNFCDATA